MTNRIRVMIVDDHRVFAEALARAFAHEPDIDVAGETIASGEEAVSATMERHPDVILMDLNLKGVDGIEATRRIKRIAPATRVVMLTAEQSEARFSEAAEAGVSGYILKSAALGELVEAVRSAAAGEILLPEPATLPAALAEVAMRDPGEHERLTDLLTRREVEILELLAAGLQSKQIAERLVLSPRTIDTHVHNLLTKLGVHSKLEAVVMGLRSGLVSLPSD